MILPMYAWKLLGHNTSEGPLRAGVGSELAAVMRTIEEELTKPYGFLGYVAEVEPHLSVLHLDAVHVPTGREWLGRRDSRGGVRWEARFRPAVGDDAERDPDSAPGLMSYPAA
jgi:hypothetical protein